MRSDNIICIVRCQLNFIGLNRSFKYAFYCKRFSNANFSICLLIYNFCLFSLKIFPLLLLLSIAVLHFLLTLSIFVDTDTKFGVYECYRWIFVKLWMKIWYILDWNKYFCIHVSIKLVQLRIVSSHTMSSLKIQWLFVISAWCLLPATAFTVKIYFINSWFFFFDVNESKSIGTKTSCNICWIHKVTIYFFIAAFNIQ